MASNENMNEEKVTQETTEAAGMDTTTAAEAPQDTHSMNYTHTFNPPIEITGTQYKSLTFYFDRLTGEDVEAVELELQQRNIIVLDATVSSAFQCGIAARASGIGADEIARLPVSYTHLTLPTILLV